jgi:hypothetical protein
VLVLADESLGNGIQDDKAKQVFAKHWPCGWAIYLKTFDDTVRGVGGGNDLAGM